MDKPQPELRWTGGPRTKGRPFERFGNTLNAEDYYRISGRYFNVSNRNRRVDQEQNAEVEKPEYSRLAVLELCVRILSWFTALGAFASAIYVSVHVRTLRHTAAFGQLAALLPLILDSWKVFCLVMERRLTKTSLGTAWYGNLLCTIGAGIVCSFLWRRGVGGGFFEPFGPANEVTIAIALMATNGAFRSLWFLASVAMGPLGYCAGS